MIGIVPYTTSYGVMSQWMAEVNQSRRPRIPEGIVANENRSPAFVKSRRNLVNGNGAPGPYITTSLTDLKPGCLVKQAAIDQSLPVHMRFTNDCGYDDFHRASRSLSQNWPMAKHPVFGPPMLRYGRAGGSWRHVKEVLQAGGARHIFVDGRVSLNDTNRLDDVPGGHLTLPDVGTTQAYKDEIDYNMETEELLRKYREQKQLRSRVTFDDTIRSYEPETEGHVYLPEIQT